MAKNECLIPFYLLNKVFVFRECYFEVERETYDPNGEIIKVIDKFTNYSSWFNHKINEKLNTYRPEAYQNAVEQGYIGTAELYFEEFMNSRNQYGMTYEEFYMDFFYDFAEEYSLSDMINKGTVKIKHKNMESGADAELNIVGYHRGTLKQSEIVAEQEYFQKLYDEAGGVYSAALGAMPTNRSDIKSLTEYVYGSLKDGERFYFDMSLTKEIKGITVLLEQCRNLMTIIGAAFCIFAILLLFNFISNTVEAKKNEIGVFRALGGGKRDVYSVFLAESLFIAAVNAVLACVLTTVLTAVFNGIIRRTFGITVSVLTFGIIPILLVVLLSFAVSVAASIIPINNIARKQPVDIIKGIS